MIWTKNVQHITQKLINNGCRTADVTGANQTNEIILSGTRDWSELNDLFLFFSNKGAWKINTQLHVWFVNPSIP